jgi:hypothetical protein
VRRSASSGMGLRDLHGYSSILKKYKDAIPIPAPRFGIRPSATPERQTQKLF